MILDPEKTNEVKKTVELLESKILKFVRRLI